MPISANIWIFPAVKKARMMKVKRRSENAPSTMRRNVGCKEEPGLRIFVINESSDGEPSVISVMGAMVKSELPINYYYALAPKKAIVDICGRPFPEQRRLTRMST